MAYVTSTGLGGVLDQGFSVQQCRLEPLASLPVAYVYLTAGQLFRLRWLSVHLVRVLSDEVPVKLNPGLGSVYAGLYPNGSVLRAPPGQPLAYTPVDVPGVNQTSPCFYYDLESSGTYTILLVNNLTNASVDVVCTGSFRVSNI